ncbi:MAG: DUF3788 family protein [Clostridiaceae bacterium]|jgi:hypothetical protein|nr:DUF3788 family protein [Clostridiaceae bacterium]
MSEKTEFQKVSEETVRFMRGKYALDEVPGKYYGIDCLKFRQGKKTILSVNIHEDHYDFQIIYGKAEREKFEARRDEFPQSIVELYDKAHTYHDGKWMLIRVDNLETLEAVKKMILIKKKPNRKPFSKENAFYGKCGHRCDLCIHFSGGTISEEFRKELEERLTRVYNITDWSMRCSGCSTPGWHTKSCEQLDCAAEKGFADCVSCEQYPCSNATAGYAKLEAKSMLADDVTWAILPYVPYQYGN